MGQWVASSWNNADEYVASGTPFLTCSANAELTNATAIQVKFPRVTKWIRVENLDATPGNIMYFGVSKNGVLSNPTANRWMVAGTQSSFFVDWKCTSIWVIAGTGNAIQFQVSAGLTNVPDGSMFALTGSAGVGGVG